MKRKSIFKTSVFWNAVWALIFVAIVVGLSCALVFYTKIFEKWGRTKVVKLEDYNGYNAIATYIVDGKEYKHQIGRTLEGQTDAGWLHDAWVGELELYVDYLVRDPDYILAHNTKRNATIILSILWVVFAGIGTAGLIFINRKK